MCSKLIHKLKSTFGLRQTIWELWTWILTNHSPLPFTFPSPPGSRPPDNCTALHFGEQLEGCCKKQPEETVHCTHCKDKYGGHSLCPYGILLTFHRLDVLVWLQIPACCEPQFFPWDLGQDASSLCTSVPQFPLAKQAWWYLPQRLLGGTEMLCVKHSANGSNPQQEPRASQQLTCFDCADFGWKDWSCWWWRANMEYWDPILEYCHVILPGTGPACMSLTTGVLTPKLIVATPIPTFLSRAWHKAGRYKYNLPQVTLWRSRYYPHLGAQNP